ncbi:beta-galactosidase [Klebsiella pneumoniae subsp. pneumoniae]|nr:beta-galactosidase [Klebsiella pneumoniae subsp. pneumoniae]
MSWDSYPMWHRDKDETALACYTAMYHDMMRSLKGGKPFVLMESTRAPPTGSRPAN